MAIATRAVYRSRLALAHNRVSFGKASVGNNGSRLQSRWTAAGFPAAGVAPTTAAVPTSATTGALPFRDSNGVQRFAMMDFSLGNSGALILCDRLSHQGGLSGTATGAQTTNLPTAALTRFTSGVGVFAAVEIYTAIGASAADVTISYTNSAGTAGRTSKAIPVSTNSGDGSAARFSIVPWQEGDVGIKSVESLTLSGSTGTVGNFGVTLFKPLAGPFPVWVANAAFRSLQYDALANAMLMMSTIPNSACLFFIQTAGSASTQGLNGVLRTVEE